VSAYAAAIAIIAGLVAWIMVDRRHLVRMLEDFERQGMTRRSGRVEGEEVLK
jgi:heme exporter protein CcmD